jgi:hypothetical protein
METDYTALASRVAARAEVLGCVILSRDGLVLGSFPPGGEEDVTPAWLRFSTLGDPQRGFVSFSDQLWAYARHGEYAAFAVAVPSARAGILLDLLEQALMEVDEAHYLREAVRAPQKVNLTFPGPREERVPPAEVAASPEGAPPEEPSHQEDAPPQEGGDIPPAPEHGRSQEDVDRVALAREFSQLLQENPKPVEEAP